MIGRRYGSLVVKSKAPSYVLIGNGRASYRARFFCDCDCGTKDVIVNAIHLRSGARDQCKGCAYRSRPQSTQRISDEERLFRLVIKSSLPSRGISCSLSVGKFMEIASMPCHYCGAAPTQRNYSRGKTTHVHHKTLMANGIDRVDCNVGYHAHNCVPCCPRCNFAKGTMGYDEFLSWVDLVCSRKIAHNNLHIG
jgi:hypothetical protein